MKTGLQAWKLAVMTAVGCGITHTASPAIAVQFDQMEIDQNRVVAIAAPIGNGRSHKLIILEQLSDARECWRERPGSPTMIDPLLLDFDFTNICGRNTDSNQFSVRVGGEDWSLRYGLRIVQKGNDLVLVAFSNQNRSLPEIEVGRTRGLTTGFAKIYLDPGWTLTRRAYQGQPVNHIYLTHTQSLPAIAAATQTTNQSSTAPISQPATQPPAQAAIIISAPSQAIPPTQRPPSQSVITIPVPPPETSGLTARRSPSAIVPTSPVPSTTSPVPSAPSSDLPSVVVAPTILQVPSLPPIAAATAAPPRSIPVLSTDQLPAPPSFGPTVTGVSYRVVVQTSSPQQQEQVRQLVPDAFRTTINGQVVMQAGVFRDRAIADALQQRLSQQNLPASVISSSAVNPPPALPSQSSRPLPSTTASLAGFNLMEPDISRLSGVALWSTYYYLHRAETISGGNPLYDMAGNHLGAELSDRDWCAAALQGSVQIVSGSRIMGTFNYSGRGRDLQVDCSVYYPRLSTVAATSRSRFQVSNTPFGEGVRGYQLVPYRTVAVDESLIPIGSVLYIPAARGISITLPSGERVVHDGYFYAADVGGAIRGNHIDVFIGPAKENPFPFVRSTQSATFQAYLVNDPQIQNRLASLHRGNSSTASLPR